MDVSSIVGRLEGLLKTGGSKESRHAQRRKAFHLFACLHALLSGTACDEARPFATRIKDLIITAVCSFSGRNAAFLPSVADVAISLCDKVDSRLLQQLLKELADPLGHWRKPSSETLA